ncbi:MAG TPA: glyceraldehyde 3-phosphate dehydrogenase NAD-binding domain-containing protein, partial [bacterium]|nr:glyceraldehyde 3-phosphate dehydrogenase NAD-binding domain-containing protein [bacterium]
MMARIGINGFGRIGRQALRAMLERYPALEVAAVNDLADVRTNAHLFKYDSTYGRFSGTVEARDGTIVINGRPIAVLSERDPARLPWRDHGVELVLESTGRFTEAQKASGHLQGGARRVVISAPATGEDVTLNMGVN